MLGVIGRRLAIAVPIVFVVVLLTFVLLRLGGGDPSAAMLGTQGTPQQYAQVRSQLGLNQPVWEQFATYLTQLLHGDLGRSWLLAIPVDTLISQRLLVTLSVTLGAILVSVLLGVPLGLLAALRGGWVDRSIQVLSTIAFAVPGFWLGLMLIVVFASGIGVLPVTGYVDPTADMVGWISHLVLPVTALAATSVAAVTLQTRSAMLDVLSRDFIRTLRANGLPERSVLFKHALRNTSSTIATVIGLQFLGLLSAVIIVETVFALPGIGSLTIDAATKHDFPVIEGLVLYLSFLVVVVNLVVDVTAAWLNPKARER